MPLKDGEGVYHELDPAFWSTGKIWFGQGVRPLGEAGFEAILAAAQAHEPSTNVRVTRKGHRGGYASPETAAAVDRYAVTVAKQHVEQRFPGVVVEEMVHNNPGFDLRVGPAEDIACFVEVKGTQSSQPVFFMSEGEREFSAAHAGRYLLVVVAGINLAKETHAEVHEHAGEVRQDGQHLQPRQWRGRLDT